MGLRAVISTGLLVLGVCGFTSLPPPAVPTPVQQVKLGFDYLTAAQMKDLWRRADDYALAEAFLKKCDRPTYVETRMRQAAGPCIRPEALNKVASYFRNKVVQYSRTHTFVCDTEQAKKTVRSAREKIARDVEEVRGMCRSCFIC